MLSLDFEKPLFLGIDPTCKTEILELWNSGIRKPKAILDFLRPKQVVCPTTSQLNNFLVRVRRGESPLIISLGQFESFILLNTAITSNYDIDKPYVVNHFFGTEFIRLFCWYHVKRNLDWKLYAFRPDLTTTLQTQAHSIAKSDRIQILTRTIDDHKLYFFPSAESKYRNIKEEISTYLRKYKAPIWRSFDSFVQFQTRMWVVNYQDTDWLSSTCTCPPFTKTGGDLMLKWARGRPKQASKALIID